MAQTDKVVNMNWFLLYYDDEGKSKWSGFELKAHLMNFIEALPEDYLIAGVINGTLDTKRG
jgi:hypothetical protein